MVALFLCEILRPLFLKISMIALISYIFSIFFKLMLLNKKERRKAIKSLNFFSDYQFDDKMIYRQKTTFNAPTSRCKTPKVYARKCETNSRFSISKACKYSQFIQQCQTMEVGKTHTHPVSTEYCK